MGNFFAVLYVVGLVHTGIRSCRIIAEHPELEKFSAVSCVLSVVVNSVTWPAAPFVMMYLGRKGGE
jgi:hypothetical protein